ncbi:amidohydrolase family protein [Paenibacillus sp. LHD-117]|uniref:amidohydrolase family protein n=1 Tax=Paenibacillus sp. LHD-117 TaxID=3071412 RepID=UPI0027E18A49|nr:amidohydrolase family protein [Paenibacillus sp. LHD-117]MDQ6423604.1 amidohydrolase family protein [Paenibacillus sp. LHD-117]
MRIDAHQHYWKIERGDYRWITPELPVLYRDFLPSDLESHLNAHNMEGTIVVQAAPTLEETEYLLTLAERSDSILGVVGWLDLFDASLRDHYERFRMHRKFVGFRIMIQDMPDASSLLAPHFMEVLSSYANEDIPVDLLVLSHQLESLVKLLEEVPGLRGIINHIAKPRIAEGLMEPWLSHMKAISKHANIYYCKLSGMVTEADHQEWEQTHFTDYIRQVLELYGPENVLFGSDWPVCLLAASYDEVVDVLEKSLPESWSEYDRERLFGENAKKFYKL